MPYVYFFLPGKVDGHKGLTNLLGNKGAHLAELSRMGLPVPPGFTISTEAFRRLHATGALPDSLRPEVEQSLEVLGRELGFRFGEPERPLLVSVRSGAPVSMPGMLSTVSNIGLTRETLGGLIGGTGDPRFAYDTFRRLIETFARAVMEPAGRGGRGVSAALAERLEGVAGGSPDGEDRLSAQQLARLCEEYLSALEEVAQRPFPETAAGQLWEAIDAVFRSWYARPAAAYRERMGIPHDIGTAVTVQAMVFGNLGGASGSGVLFTRDPVTGAPPACGEWLPHAQGGDVVDGLLTPHLVSAGGAPRFRDPGPTLEVEMPGAFRRLLELAKLLEAHYREVQEIEFIIQEGRLWVLQTRSTGLSRPAAVRAAVEMVREGLITVDEALERTAAVPLDDVSWALEPGAAAVVASGRPASAGVASGVVALTAERAEQYARAGRGTIFISDYIEPGDIDGIDAADGLVTNRGGAASHLAVTARGWNKVCVVGCGTLRIDARGGTVRAGGLELKEGDEVTVDGGSGFIYRGRLARRRDDGAAGGYAHTLREWRRQRRPPGGRHTEGAG